MDDSIALRAGRMELTGRQPDRFESLLFEHERMVYRVALRLLGNAEDARDAAQEVFLRLHRSLASVDASRDAGPWLYRVTVNVSTDILRTRKTLVPIDSVPLASRAPQYEKRDIEAALQRLPEKERAVILLRDVEGLSTAEVAKALGSSEGTVRSQISTARVKLRAWLTGRSRV